MAAVEPEDELEQAALMTDAEAVRRAFNAHNAVWTLVEGTLFTLTNIGLVLYSIWSKEAPRLSWLVALVMTCVSVVTVWVMKQISTERGFIPRSVSAAEESRKATVRAVSRNLPDWIVAYYLLQFFTLVYVTPHAGPIVWASIFPWPLIGLRFPFVRRLLLHVAFLAILLITLYARSVPRQAKNIVPLLISNAIPVGIGALTSRRVRRNTIERWTERRTSAREQMRMRDELRFARELQLSMLPEAAPVLDWADIAGVSIPATEVGGDYFDYIDVDGALAVICGDVAGHGMASGITLSALRGGITLLRHEFKHPAAVLERLHEVVSESSRKRTLVTLAAVLFDPRRRVATVANAGHPPILIRRASGLVDSIELFGPPLGVRRNEPVPEREVYFGPGDIFLLHSDGVYEATNSSGDQYGLDRLSALLASSAGSAVEVRDAVLRSVAEFRGSAPQQDDVTVVVVKMT
jgi:Stage II sporulation protein E (SpoIIE)